MTTAEPNRNELEASDAQCAESLLYLLGELDTEACKRFEEKLASNADLSDALLQQASLITAVAGCRAVDCPSPQRAASVHAASENAHVDASRRWRWIAAVASVAACIALMFQLLRFSSQPGRVASTQFGSKLETAAELEESVLIAKAWASSHHALKSEAVALYAGDSDVDELADPHTDETFDLGLDDQSSDIDSTISWMFIAISSSSDTPSEEGNDG